jgi:hypothetical protein
MNTDRPKRYSLEEIQRALRNADVILDVGVSHESMLKVLDIGDKTYRRWRQKYDAFVDLNRDR